MCYYFSQGRIGYEMLSEELKNSQCKWIVKGPPDRRYDCVLLNTWVL